MTSRFSALSCLVLLAALSVWVVVQTGRPEALNYDVAYILAHAERMLDGARYGRDVIDVNPPLIFWLKVPLVLAARILGLPAWWAYNGLVFLLILTSTFLCHRYFVTAGSERNDIHVDGRVLAATLCLSLVLIPGYNFGQRDHLLLILTLPYLFTTAGLARGYSPAKKERVGVALMAGVGIALKPFFVLPWIAAELALLWLCRDWRLLFRVENGIIFGVQVFYIACVFAFTDYADVVPFALQVYPSFGASISDLFVRSFMYWVAFVVAVVLWLVAPVRENEKALRFVLGTTLIGFLAAALAQHKFFVYHFLPTFIIAVVMSIFVLFQALRASRRFAEIAPTVSKKLPNLFLASLVGFGVISSFEPLWRTNLAKSSQNLRLLAEVVETHARDKPVLFLNIHIYPTFPVVNVAGARWTSPHGSMWVIPGVYEGNMDRFPYRDFHEMGEIERRFVTDVVDDIAENRPVLIVVDRDVRKKGRDAGGFDFLEYFRREPRFGNLFEDYVLFEKVGGFDVFKRQAHTSGLNR